jgi:beta-lactamase class A
VLATMTLDAAGKVSSLVLHDETSDAVRRALERFFTQQPARADWFAPAFLAAIPIDQIATITAQLVAQEGAFERLEVRDGTYYAVFAKAENHVIAALDAEGRFTTLRLLSPVARTVDLDDALAKLGAVGGDVAYLITEDGKDVAAAAADRPMAVGSSFKLIVLAALRAQIDAKRHAWNDVVPLPAGAKSLPSGTYQEWPDGLPITLATYAAQMISISDNTAADVLARIVGRAELEELSPRNAPFLTTRELFSLKSKNAALREAYRAGDLAARRAILAKLDGQAAPDVANLDLSPAYLDLEWYVSNRELCGFMARVQDLPLMTINPGIPSPGWKRIAYKGGSDAGVLNLTSYVTAPDGTSYCVSATWNDRTRSPDENACIAAFGAVLAQLARR